MDCLQAKQLIHEYLDGGAFPEELSQHLQACKDCRDFLHVMEQQCRQLAELRPQHAPKFDLAAAQKAKIHQRRRKIRRITAACASVAAVFIAVVAIGSLGSLTASKSDAAMESIIADTVTEGESFAADAPADMPADAPAEPCPAPDDSAEDTVPEKPSAPAPTAKPGEENFPGCDPSQALPALSAEEYDTLRFLLTQNHIPITEYEAHNYFSIAVTEENLAPLTELLEPYIDFQPKVGEIIRLRKK